MIESLLLFLIYVALIVGAAWLIVWVMALLGFGLPPMIVNVIKVVIVLIVLLLLWRMIGPTIGRGRA